MTHRPKKKAEQEARKRVKSIIKEYIPEAVKKWPKRLWREIIMIQIMERMWWSYEQYMNTPERVRMLILEKDNIDAKK